MDFGSRHFEIGSRQIDFDSRRFEMLPRQIEIGSRWVKYGSRQLELDENAIICEILRVVDFEHEKGEVVGFSFIDWFGIGIGLLKDEFFIHLA